MKPARLVVAFGCACVAVGCVGQRPDATARADAGPPPFAHVTEPPDDSVAVDVVFEPPLPEPGRLTITHESGYAWSGAVGRTGASVLVPQGPCSLRLECGGRSRDAVVRIEPDMPPFHWRLEAP